MKQTYKIILFLILNSLIITACHQESTKPGQSVPADTKVLPTALFITSGINFNQEDPALPSGIVLAIQEMSKNGIPVQLSDRDILLKPGELKKYQILILLTAEKIHDADRKYSLSYMTDTELNNIAQFVNNGGYLIAGDNVGRNTFEGEDRILETGSLSPENYILSSVYGMIFKEINLKDFTAHGIKKPFKKDSKPVTEDDLWLATGIKSISKDLDTLAVWQKNDLTYPAVTSNKYGKGMSFLIAMSDWLMPINNGGESSVAQIQTVYRHIVDNYFSVNNLKIRPNLWPNACQAAFAISFNPGDTLPAYRFVNQKLQKQNIKPTFFINGLVDKNIQKYLKDKNADLASSGYSYSHYGEFDFADASHDILMNESVWQQKFKGFRFPFTTPTSKGLLALHKNEYNFDSSISANQIDFIHGSVIPYNLVISGNDYYQTTSMLEIAPTYHDDYFFIGKLKTNEYKNPQQYHSDLLRYRQYLQDYWQFAVKPNKGLMLVLAHPDLTGYDKTSFTALQSIIDTVKKQQVWLTNLTDVNNYYHNKYDIKVYVKQTKKSIKLLVRTPGNESIQNYTVVLNEKPKNVKAKINTAEIKQIKNKFYIIFDAVNGQEVNINLL